LELNRRPVASLWIGEKLHYINQLCLKSHLHHGHPVILYCTDDVSNVPEGVEVRPASQIMDISTARVKETSASFWSNVFRYQMIKKTGAIWIDCDAFCHQPFPDDQEWVFAGHGMRGALNCGVVGLPQDCELMDQLLDYYEHLPDYPPWWNRKQRAKMDALPTDMPQATRIYKAERTAFGPQAFTHFVKVTDNMDRAMSPSALYPVPFQLVDVFFDPHGSVEGWMGADTLSVHLYTNGIKPYWQNNPPMPNSFVARMCAQIGIDPDASLRDEVCDIAPRGSGAGDAPSLISSAGLETAHRTISDLEDQLQKAGRRARRKAANARADGFLDGVCGLLKPGDVAIDLGAHMGDVSAKLLATGADVIGFDPAPDAVAQISERLGEHPNYTFYDKAAGLEEGIVRNFRASSFGIDDTSPQDGGVDVKQIDFIAFIKDIIAQRGAVAFLKVDIEGMELDLLEKMHLEDLFKDIRCVAVKTYQQKFQPLRPRFRSLRKTFSAHYAPSHVNLDWS
jgi:FkbM family methyltransferase